MPQDATNGNTRPTGRLEDQDAPEAERDFESEYLAECQLREYEQREREQAEVVRAMRFCADFHAHCSKYTPLLEERAS